MLQVLQKLSLGSLMEKCKSLSVQHMVHETVPLKMQLALQKTNPNGFTHCFCRKRTAVFVAVFHSVF